MTNIQKINTSEIVDLVPMSKIMELWRLHLNG